MVDGLAAPRQPEDAADQRADGVSRCHGHAACSRGELQVPPVVYLGPIAVAVASRVVSDEDVVECHRGSGEATAAYRRVVAGDRHVGELGGSGVVDPATAADRRVVRVVRVVAGDRHVEELQRAVVVDRATVDVTGDRGAVWARVSAHQRDVAQVEAAVGVDLEHAGVRQRLLDDHAPSGPQDLHPRLRDLQMAGVIGRVDVPEGQVVAASEVGEDDRVARTGGRDGVAQRAV